MIELQPSRVLVNDRFYERPLFGAVALPFDSAFGYVCILGSLARPTPEEADGMAQVPDAEPFRKILKKEPDRRWRYSDDVIIEVIAEAMLTDLRSLQERIVDLAFEYKTPYFYCHPLEKDLALRSSTLCHEISRRRFSGRRNPQFEYIPVIQPAFTVASHADQVFDNAVRTVVAMGHLQINDGCRHVLSQNPLALRALGVGVFQGVTFPMKTDPDVMPVLEGSVAESYYGSRGGEV